MNLNYFQWTYKDLHQSLNRIQVKIKPYDQINTSTYKASLNGLINCAYAYIYIYGQTTVYAFWACTIVSTNFFFIF